MTEEVYLEPEEEEAMAQDYGDSYMDHPKMPGAPTEREKNTVVEFLNKVFKTPDSTKVAYNFDEEVEAIRKLQAVAHYAKEMNWNIVSNYLRGKAEIVSATTLGRNGNLVNAAITSKKEFQARLKEPKKNPGWFKKGGIK